MKNLIFIVVDDLRKDFMLSEGKRGFKQFLDSGIFLKNLFVHAPDTYTSCGTYFTGLYPPHHKLGLANADKNLKTIYDYLRPYGYKFLTHGKFSPFGVSYGTGYYQEKMGRVPDEVGNTTMNFDIDLTTTYDFIKKMRSEQSPYFVFNHIYTLRHLEKVMGEEVDVCCEKGNINKVIEAYKTSIRKVDDSLLEYFDFIRKDLENTIIVITADHGESFKLYDNHILGNFGNAWTLHNGSRFEETINVPMIITGGGLPHKSIDAQIRQIDILPTILELFGIHDYQTKIDGEPIDITNSKLESKDIIVYSTSESKKQAIRSVDNWKLIFDSKDMELYDLMTDSKEQNNVILDNPKIVEKLFKLLLNFPNDEIITSKELLFRYTDYKNINYVNNLFKELGLQDEWEKRSPVYDNLNWVNNSNYIKRIVDLFNITTGKENVLSVGCGTGTILKELRKLTPNCFGIDSSPAMLEKVPKNIEVKVGTADNIPYPDNFFDCLLLRMVLHHVDGKDLHKVMGECKRVLKKNGIIIISEGVPIKDSLIASYKSFIQEKENRIFFVSRDLINLATCYFELENVQFITLQKQSINNWLNNSGTSNLMIKKIFNKHRDQSEKEYKEAAHFTNTDNDVLIDMKYIIITSTKF